MKLPALAFCVMSILPFLVVPLPVASAGTSCELVYTSGQAPYCNFICYNNDTVSILWASYDGGNALPASVVADCGGVEAACTPIQANTAGQCSAAGATNGIGVCTFLLPLGADAVEGGAVLPVIDMRVPRDSVVQAECGASGGDTTPYDCVQNLNPSDPGPSDPIGEASGVAFCTNLYWLANQGDSTPVSQEYQEQFPGCYPPGCILRASIESAFQTDPSMSQIPSYLVAGAPPSTRCNGTTCTIAVLAHGWLLGWNGTAILQCSPGTTAVSPPQYGSVQCTRGGFNVGPAATQDVYSIESFDVPVGICRSKVIQQIATATLLIGPLGEQYQQQFQPVMVQKPVVICNGVKPPNGADLQPIGIGSLEP
jgi:hypothetical protein